MEDHMQETVNKRGLESEFYTDEKCYIAELSNTPDDPDVSLARARVEPGVTTRRHRLKGIAERYYILSGKGRVEIGELPSREVQAGDVILIPPMCTQRISNIGKVDLLFLAICTPRFTRDAYIDVENLTSPL